MKRFCAILALLNICYSSTAACKEINEHGYWIGTDVESEHAFDQKLAQNLTDFFKKEHASSIVDFGCGKGDYVKYFCKNGLTCDGYDGNPNTEALSGGVAKVLDLSAPIDLHQTFDWVVSLEVGEHLPQKYEKIFIENLVHHCKKGIVLSWAIKGQSGYGHVNTQNNDYIKARLAEYGFTNDVQAENEMRNAAHLRWFKNTIMVFRKISTASTVQ